jgi:hypothetical protein
MPHTHRLKLIWVVFVFMPLQYTSATGKVF